MQIMKIGIITDAIDDNAPGIGNYAKNLIKQLLLLDHNNKYFLIHYKHGAFYDELENKIKNIIIPLRGLPLYKEYRKIILMPYILKKYHFDLVHELTQIGPFFLPTKFKKIVTIHDLTALKLPEKHKKIDYYRHKLGLPIILRKVDKIITDSYSTQNDLLEYFSSLKLEKKIKTIHLGVNENYFNKISEAEKETTLKKYNLQKPYIIYIGTIEPRKNINGLLEIICKLKQKSCQYKLVIVGKFGWKYSSILEKIKKLNLKNKVIFTGFISEQDKINLLQAAELMIYPSLYEGFGLPVLEAMACGCPVITSNNSSLKEISFNNEMLFDPFNTDEIYLKTKRIITDQSYRNYFISRGFEHAKKFSWQKTAQETLNVYNNLKK